MVEEENNGIESWAASSEKIVIMNAGEAAKHKNKKVDLYSAR